MGYIVTINSESKQALALLEIVKSFDFTKVKKIKKTALSKPKITKNNDLTDEDKDFIMALSKKTNKGIAKKWDNYFKKP